MHYLYVWIDLYDIHAGIHAATADSVYSALMSERTLEISEKLKEWLKSFLKVSD